MDHLKRNFHSQILKRLLVNTTQCLSQEVQGKIVDFEEVGHTDCMGREKVLDE